MTITENQLKVNKQMVLYYYYYHLHTLELILETQQKQTGLILVTSACLNY